MTTVARLGEYRLLERIGAGSTAMAHLAVAARGRFSWAATVTFAATGRPPFGIGSPHRGCFRILRGAADLHGVPEPLASPPHPALGRDPDTRPAAARPASDLARWSIEPILARRG
jgi:hypothetical protein